MAMYRLPARMASTRTLWKKKKIFFMMEKAGIYEYESVRIYESKPNKTNEGLLKAVRRIAILYGILRIERVDS